MLTKFVLLDRCTFWFGVRLIIAKFVGFLCEFSFSDVDKMLACVHDREQLFRGYCFVCEELIVFSKAASSMHNRQSSIQINSSRIEHRGSVEFRVNRVEDRESIRDPRCSRGSRIECQLTLARYCTCTYCTRFIYDMHLAYCYCRIRMSKASCVMIKTDSTQGSSNKRKN